MGGIGAATSVGRAHCGAGDKRPPQQRERRRVLGTLPRSLLWPFPAGAQG